MQTTKDALPKQRRAATTKNMPSEARLKTRVNRKLGADPRLNSTPKSTVTTIRDAVLTAASEAVRSSNIDTFFNQSVDAAVSKKLITVAQADELRAVATMDSPKQLKKRIDAASALWNSNPIMVEATRNLSMVTATLVPPGNGEVTVYGDFGDAAQIIIGAAGLGAAIGGVEGAIPGAVIGGVVGAVVAAVALAGDSALSEGDDDEDSEDDGGSDESDGGDTGDK
jgi:hypothetical protein